MPRCLLLVCCFLIGFNTFFQGIGKIYFEQYYSYCGLSQGSRSIWVATEDDIYKLDRSKEQFTALNLKTVLGLTNMTTFRTVLADSRNQVWVGIYEEGISILCNATDGLQSNEFNTNCAYVVRDGTMYFGRVKSISFFKPESLTSNSFVPRVKITNVKVMHYIYKDSPSSLYVIKIDLPYDQNYISLEFAAFNFSNSERNTYRYTMEGLEKEWINAGARKSANYTNLSPGNYTFMVRGPNNDDVENSGNTTIEIDPPFWRAIWFRLLLAMLFLEIVCLIYRSKIKSIRNEERQKSDIRRIRLEAEMAVVRAQISPDFILNSLNAIEAYTLTNRRREASHYLQVFSKLIKIVLENSHQDLVSIEDDLQALKLFVQLEEERYDYAFSTQFEIDPVLIANKYQIPPLLIQPFVESAIIDGLANREGKNGSLRIFLYVEDSQLKVSIEDNSNETESTAHASEDLAANRLSPIIQVAIKRIKALGNLYETATSCEISQTASGTTIQLLLPLLNPLF